MRFLRKIEEGRLCGSRHSHKETDFRMYEVLHKVAKMSGADIAASSYRIGDGLPAKACACEYAVFSQREAILRVLQGRWEMLYVWGKLFAREMVKPLRFCPSYAQTEDGPFAIQAIARCNKFASLEYQCYHYFIRANSISHVFTASIGTTLKAIDSIVDVIKGYDQHLALSADKCTLEYDVIKAKDKESEGRLSRQVHGEIVAQAKAHLSGGSWGLLPCKFKLWLCLLLLGRRPFLFGRKISRALARSFP